MNYKKIILVVSFLAVFGFLFNFGTPVAKAITVDEIRAQINALLAQITQLQQQLAQIQGTPAVWCHTFNVNLKYGDSGSEVYALQMALTKEFGKPAGNMDNAFDEFTASDVVGFQEKYKSEILTPWGLAHGTGFVGNTTRAKLNKLYGCGVIPTPPPTALTCGQLKEAPASLSYFGLCKNQGYDKVCFNKYSYVYQGCGRSSYNNCTVNNVNAAQNIWCDSGLITTAPSITVLFPNGGEQWQIGSTYQVKWNSSNLPTDAQNRITIGLILKGTESNLRNFISLIGATANDGNENITIPSSISPGDYKIQIAYCPSSGGECSVKDNSDNYFSIVATSVAPVILYISPSSGVQDIDIFNMTIKGYGFIGAGDYSGCGISPVSDNGFQLLSCRVISDSEIEAKFSISTTATIGIRYITVQTPKGGTSNKIAFTITATTTPSITVLSPNGGERWTQGRTYQVTWQRTNFNNEVAINLIDYTPGSRYGMQYGITNGINIRTVAGQTSFSWTISTSIPVGDYYKVSIGSGSVNDFSDNYFSIIAPTYSCTDSDSPNGISINPLSPIYLKGTVMDNIGNSYTDYCVNSNTIREYGCSRDGSMAYQDFACSYGCQNGACQSVPSITVILPNGGETWTTGDTTRISWTSSGLADSNSVAISVSAYDSSYNSLGRAYLIPQYYAINNQYIDWTIPSDFKNNWSPAPFYFKIRVSIVGQSSVYDDSNSYFIIASSASGLNNMENQLADISKVISQLMEGIKNLMGR